MHNYKKYRIANLLTIQTTDDLETCFFLFLLIIGFGQSQLCPAKASGKFYLFFVSIASCTFLFTMQLQLYLNL